MWDTAGEEKFRSMLPMYYKDAKAAILVYDITSPDSFTSIDYWVEALKEHLNEDQLIIFLVGNKSDVPKD